MSGIVEDEAQCPLWRHDALASETPTSASQRHILYISGYIESIHISRSLRPAQHTVCIHDRLDRPESVVALLPDISMARLSGLQRDVLSLYRKCLRAARKKPEVSAGGQQDILQRAHEIDIPCRTQDRTLLHSLGTVGYLHRRLSPTNTHSGTSSSNMLISIRKTLELSNTCFEKVIVNWKYTNPQVYATLPDRRTNDTT